MKVSFQSINEHHSRNFITLQWFYRYITNIVKPEFEAFGQRQMQKQTCRDADAIDILNTCELMLRFFSLSLLPKSLLLSSEFCRYVLFFNPPIDAISQRINHGNRLLFCYQIHAHLQSFSRIKPILFKVFSPWNYLFQKASSFMQTNLILYSIDFFSVLCIIYVLH